VSMSRLAGLPRSALGSALAHAGMGATVIGIVCATAYQSETIAALAPGQTMEVAVIRCSTRATHRERVRITARSGRSSLPRAAGPSRSRLRRPSVSTRRGRPPRPKRRSRPPASPSFTSAWRRDGGRHRHHPSLLQADGDADLGSGRL
jgi:hypothetical protein